VAQELTRQMLQHRQPARKLETHRSSRPNRAPENTPPVMEETRLLLRSLGKSAHKQSLVSTPNMQDQAPTHSARRFFKNVPEKTPPVTAVMLLLLSTLHTKK
jgi:hypothetical protein